MLNQGTTKMLSKWIAFGLVLVIISYASATAQRSPYNKNEGTKDLPTKTDTVTDKSNIKDNQESASVKDPPDGDEQLNDPIKNDEPVKNDQNIQAGSRSSDETGSENGPPNGQTESFHCEMIPSPHMRAFDFDEQSGRKTFSEPFKSMMRRSKNDKEILMKLQAFMIMLEEFLKSLHPLSTKMDIRQLFRSLNLGDQGLLFRIKSLFRFGSTEDFTAKEFNDFINIIRTLDEEPMNGAVNRMNDQMLKLLCTDHLIKFPCLTMFAALEAMKSKSASCLQFDNIPTKIQFVSLKVKWNKSPKDWQADNWNEIIHTYMDVFVEFTILHYQIPDNIVLRMWQPISKRCSDIPKSSNKVLFKKIKRAFGNLTENMMGEYKTPVFRFIKKCGGDASEFATKEEEVNDFKPGDSKSMSSRKRAEMARNVPKVLGKTPSELTTEEIIQYIELLMSNRYFLKQLNPDNLKLAICKIGEMKDLKLKSVIKFKQVMMVKIPEYRKINYYDISKVRCLQHLLAGYNRHQIGRIPDNVMAASINDGILKDVRFRCFPARVILYKFKIQESPHGELKAEEMMNFGIMLRCFKAKHWKDIKPEEFTDEVIEHLATGYEMRNIKPRRNVMIAILDLATQREGAMDKLAATYLGSFLPEGVGKGYIIARQLQNGMETIMECTCEEAKICWNELTETLGPLSEWDPSYITKLVGSTIWYGMDLATIGSIPDTILYSFPPEDLMSANCSSFKQIELMFRRSRIVREEDSFTSNTLIDYETEVNPTKGLQWFYNASMADLIKYNEETREQICVELGAVDISRVSIQDIREIIQICPWCTPSVITNEIFEKCGTLMCGLSRSQIMNIDADAFKTHAKDLCEKCPWNNEHKNVLIRAGMQSEAINSSMPSFTEVDICTLGTCTKSLSKELLESIPLEMLYTSNECITESSEKKKSNMQERMTRGIKKDLSDEEKTMEKEAEVDYSGVLLKSVDQMLQDSLYGTNRKKRSVGFTLTCDALAELGDGVIALTVEDIGSIPDDEITNCLEILGGVSTWSIEQKRAILTLLQKQTVFGQPGTWTSDTLSSAGAIIQGMTIDEIKSLQLDVDAMEVLGEQDGWTEAQKKEAFQRFLDYYKNGQHVNALSAAEISILGHFTCGMTTDQIATIHHTTYLNASEAIGQVTSCNELQFIEWAKLAKLAFGDDVSTWDTSTIQRVGTVIGGLKEEDIQKLSEDHIDSINPDHITYIPTSTFEKFSKEQLGFFSSSQAQSTTTSQLEALNPEQLSVLVRIASTVDASIQASQNQGGSNYAGSFGKGNYSERLSSSWIGTVILVCSGILLYY